MGATWSTTACRSLWTWPWKFLFCKVLRVTRWQRAAFESKSQIWSQLPSCWAGGRRRQRQEDTSSNNEPKSNLGIIIGCVVAALVLAVVIAGILVFFKRRQDDYNAVPRRNQAI